MFNQLDFLILIKVMDLETLYKIRHLTRYL